MFPYKLTAFDLDGTLTRSKTPITPEMAGLLQKLSETTKVAIISGGSIVQFEKQLLPFIKPSKNIILLPVDGSERFEYNSESKKWQLTDKHEFKKSIKEKVIKALGEIIDSGLFEIPKEHQGKYVEDRDTEINLSAMGQDAPLEIKEKWDPDQKKRRKIEKEIERKIPEVDATVAGTTSVDILPKGFDKAYGLGILLEKIKIDKKDVIFLGDAVFPGGNDYSVMEDGIKTVKVDGPTHTEGVIRSWFGEKNNPTISIPQNPIAYFCAEYAIEENTLMYAGGLGILAGDYLMEMADKNMPFIAIGLNYDPGNLKDFAIFSHQGKSAVVSIPIGEHLIYAQIWHRRFAENTHVFLLDTNFEKNDDKHRNITSHLYDPHFYTRVKQQIVLGIGGIKFLKLLDIHPSVYHLNEGHTAFAGVGVLVERNEDIGKIVGTKHTILSAAGLYIPKKDFFVLLNTYCKEFGVDINEIFEKGKYELDPDTFSTTKLVMTTSKIKNSVSALHAVFEKIRHPHSELISITNG
ncbi:MAG: HAD-IIB family hydrolase, partial [Patescibacteria group bacterium]